MTSTIACTLDTGILRSFHGSSGGLCARWVMQSIRAKIDALWRLNFLVKSLPQPSMGHLCLAGPASFRLDKLALSTLGVATFFLGCPLPCILRIFIRGLSSMKLVGKMGIASGSCLRLGSHWPPSGHCNAPYTRSSPRKAAYPVSKSHSRKASFPKVMPPVSVSKGPCGSESVNRIRDKSSARGGAEKMCQIQLNRRRILSTYVGHKQGTLQRRQDCRHTSVRVMDFLPWTGQPFGCIQFEDLSGGYVKIIAHMLNTSPLTEKLVALHLVNPKKLRVVEISRRNESVAPTNDGRHLKKQSWGRPF